MTKSPSSYLLQTVCPLCEQPNQCAIAAGQDAASCWCMTACIPAGVLLAIAPASRGTRCICPQCAQVIEDPAAAGLTDGTAKNGS